ncbi:MAG TPA: limonene-1,2-epoxide hydrolase family protein [Candidatus Binatia bacterium]|nr:limonene-1,2-epoxide hydrolase family protein [Candidatus Binatia bacterium]
MALDNEQIVLDFLAAWPRANVDELMRYFAPDAVYHNVPVAPIQGADRIREIFQAFLGLMNRIDLDVVNSAAKGNVVFTERIDRFHMKNGKKFDLPVNGIFELREGKIVRFRDYFNLADWEKPSGMPLG